MDRYAANRLTQKYVLRLLRILIISLSMFNIGCTFLEYSEVGIKQEPSAEYQAATNPSQLQLQKAYAHETHLAYKKTLETPNALIFVYRVKDSLISISGSKPPEVYFNNDQVEQLNYGEYLCIDAPEGMHQLTVYSNKDKEKLGSEKESEKIWVQGGQHHFFQLRKKSDNSYYLLRKPAKSAKHKLIKLKAVNPEVLRSYITKKTAPHSNQEIAQNHPNQFQSQPSAENEFAQRNPEPAVYAPFSNNTEPDNEQASSNSGMVNGSNQRTLPALSPYKRDINRRKAQQTEQENSWLIFED